jgi:hypothetical protein
MEESFSGIAPPQRLKPAFVLTAVLAALLIVAAIPGAFVAGIYRDTSIIVAADRGSDLLTLFLYVPILAVSVYYSSRGSLRAQIVWLGLVSWVLYYYILYAFGMRFTRLFLLHVAIVSTAAFILAIVLRRTDPNWLAGQFFHSVPRHLIVVYLWIVAVMFALLWLADIVPALVRNQVPQRLSELGTTSNPVEINDLAFIVPLLVLAGLWSWRRRPEGYLLAGILLGLATATMAALIPGGPIFAGIPPDPIYSTVAVLSLVLLVALLRGVRAPAETTTRLGEPEEELGAVAASGRVDLSRLD